MYGGGYLYLPLAILIFLPFGFLNYTVAKILFCLFNVLLIFISLYFILKILEYYNIHISNWERVGVFFSILFFYPVVDTILAGQINIATILTVIIFYYYFQKNNTLIAAISLVLGTIMKILPCILLIYILIKKRYDVIYNYFIFLCAAIILSFLFFGMYQNLQFIQTFLNFESSIVTNESNISIWIKFYSLLNFIKMPNYLLDLAMAAMKFFVFIIILILLITYRRLIKCKEGEILFFSLIILLVFLFPNTVWKHYGSFLILSYILIIYCLQVNKIERILIYISILLFSIYPYLYAPAFKIISQIVGLDQNFVMFIPNLNPTFLAPWFLFIFIIFKLRRMNSETSCYQMNMENQLKSGEDFEKHR
jgi:hypothetical protein